MSQLPTPTHSSVSSQPLLLYRKMLSISLPYVVFVPCFPLDESGQLGSENRPAEGHHGRCLAGWTRTCVRLNPQLSQAFYEWGRKDHTG